MTKNRTIATLAAVGGLTATMALLSGSPAAKADELADLRANQELLQRRLDQLAQAPAPGNPYGVGMPPGPTNVQMMGGSFPRSFLIPGTDTSIRLGGEARLSILHWFNGGNPNDVHRTNAGATGQSAVTPLSKSGAGRRRGEGVTVISPQQSKLSVETRTPTSWGEARTFIEFDFADNSGLGNRPFAVSDNISLRLRLHTAPWAPG